MLMSHIQPFYYRYCTHRVWATSTKPR